MKIVRSIITILVIAGLAVGGFFLYQRYQRAQAAAQNTYQTVTLTRGDLTATVGATGTVRASQTAMLSWQTTGSVGKVTAQVGQQVKDGDVVASLDRASLPQNVIAAEADLVTAQRNLDNLKTSSLAKAQAQVNLVTAQKAVDDAKTKRGYLDNQRGSQAQVDAARANYYLAKDEVDRLQQIYNRFSGQPEDDPSRALALSNLSAAKEQLRKSLVNLNWYLGTPSTSDFAERDANVQLAEAQLADAQREVDRLANGADPSDINAAEARVAALQAALDSQYLKAPFNGTITQVSSMVGDQVAPGTVAFRLDDLSRLLVDVQVSEIDINRIKAGQAVTMTFDAIPDKTYNGKVDQVGQVGTTVQGAVNFTVTVQLTNADADVLPGMTAAVNIVVNQLHDVLLVPNRAVRVVDGQRTLYVLASDGSLSTKTIELGASSDVDSEVTSGDVKAGDVIVLNPPTDFRVGGGGGNPFGGR